MLTKYLCPGILSLVSILLAHDLDSPLLFLGPGYGNTAGKSEVFQLSSEGDALSPAACSIPTYPISNILGATAFLHDGYLHICGGAGVSACYALKDGAWEVSTPLPEWRRNANAMTLPDGTGVVGGGGHASIQQLDSQEEEWESEAVSCVCRNTLTAGSLA